MTVGWGMSRPDAKEVAGRVPVVGGFCLLHGETLVPEVRQELPASE
jgi:hypothetical protein